MRRLMNRKLTERLKKKAIAAGFNAVGVVSAVPGRRLDAYLNWIASGMQGEMNYLARRDRVIRRENPAVILPGIRSIVCLGLHYDPVAIPNEIVNDPGRGRISNYAWGVDYHGVMEPLMRELADWLRQESGQSVTSKVYVDTGAILERDHAESAGLGFTGKNTMLIAPRRGSWFFLGELLTTLELDYDEPTDLPSCGRCQRCLDACPTGAFPAPYVLDARACISYLTIELKGWIPQRLRPSMGNWIFGCDVCQLVCPFNRFATGGADTANVFQPVNWDSVAPPLLDLLTMDEQAFVKRFANSPIKRIKRRGLVRNACVAAGNWGSSRAIPALVCLLSDAEPLVRGHAAWALRQIGTSETHAAIASVMSEEQDPEVRREMKG